MKSCVLKSPGVPVPSPHASGEGVGSCGSCVPCGPPFLLRGCQQAGPVSRVSSMGDTAALIRYGHSHVQPGGNKPRTAAKHQQETSMSRDDRHLQSFLFLLPAFLRAHPLDNGCSSGNVVLGGVYQEI